MNSLKRKITAGAILAIALVLITALPPAMADIRTPMIPAGFSQLAETAKPGVVNIRTETIVQGGGQVFRHFFGQQFGAPEGLEDFFAPFFEQQPRTRKAQSLGSGFIISKDGYIVTNNHVVKKADEITVILANGEEYKASVVGTDPMTDLALIKIDKKGLHPLKFGKSSKAQIGSWVVAIGNPFGLEQTVTAGIISAKGRIIGAGPYDNFIQTDASINPGNSGGPLLNLDGEVIGINTAIAKGGTGIGFAIPSDMATGIIDQLLESKQVSRGWLGVSIQEINDELADYYGIEDQDGVYITKVYEDNPAHKAGIRAGDVIVKINDKPVATPRDLSLTIAGLRVGEYAKITLIRDGKQKEVKVKLGERPSDDPETIISKEGFDNFGFQFQNLDARTARRFGYPMKAQGLVVSMIKPGSKAARSPVRPGDMLVEVNRRRITSFADYQKAMSHVKKGQTIRLLFRRGNSYVFAISMKP